MALALFCALVAFTRASRRRVLGAVASVVVFTLLSAPIDTMGLRLGLWSYPSCTDPPHPPLLVYIGQALVFVGSIALVGFRVLRRFGARGGAVLTLLVCGLGAIRDFTIAAVMPDVIRVGPLPASAIADVLAWGVVVAVALGVTRIVAGPAREDVLRTG
jgi:hypothetical protein